MAISFFRSYKIEKKIHRPSLKFGRTSLLEVKERGDKLSVVGPLFSFSFLLLPPSFIVYGIVSVFALRAHKKGMVPYELLFLSFFPFFYRNRRFLGEEKRIYKATVYALNSDFKFKIS